MLMVLASSGFHLPVTALAVEFELFTRDKLQLTGLNLDQVVNGIGSTVNRVLDGSTYPG
jgi:hypothetical protein